MNLNESLILLAVGANLGDASAAERIARGIEAAAVVIRGTAFNEIE
jgi:hypothetical protein